MPWTGRAVFVRIAGENRVFVRIAGENRVFAREIMCWGNYVYCFKAARCSWGRARRSLGPSSRGEARCLRAPPLGEKSGVLCSSSMGAALGTHSNLGEKPSGSVLGIGTSVLCLVPALKPFFRYVPGRFEA